MKTAVITGTSSGIGKAICDLLLNEGFKVYGISKTYSEVENQNFVWIEADLTDNNSYEQIPENIAEGYIDVLINNAGIAFEHRALDFSDQNFNRIFNLNFKAPILLTQALKEKIQNGLVINTSSVSDRLVGENYSLYCSSKSALNIYFDVIALEEINIKFLSILPSYVDTPLLRKLQENNKEFDWLSVIKAEEIAQFVGQLVKDNSSFPSGAKIIIVSDALREDLEYNENLWGYNVTTKKLLKLKR